MYTFSECMHIAQCTRQYWVHSNKYVLSYLRTLKMWHYPHFLLLSLLRPRAAVAPAVQQPIDIFYPPSPQQQTRRTLLQRANETDRRTDRRRDRRADTVPFHRPCSAIAYYAGSASKRSCGESDRVTVVFIRLLLFASILKCDIMDEPCRERRAVPLPHPSLCSNADGVMDVGGWRVQI